MKNNQLELSRIASNLHSRGLPIIPLKGKIPRVRNWSKHSNQMPTHDEQIEYLTRIETGIGLVLGECSKIIAIDIDTTDSLTTKKIINLLPQTPLGKIGKKGCTLFYQYSGERSQKLKGAHNEMIVELLSNGNQTVIPPSLHPETMRPYRYINSNSFEEVDLSNLPTLPTDIFNILRKNITTGNLHGELSVQNEGRNEKLKEIATAKLYAGEDIVEIVNFLVSYDQKNHMIPLFSDKSESICVSDPHTNALKLISNLLCSYNKSGNVSIPLLLNDDKDTEKIDVLSIGEMLEEDRFEEPIPIVNGLINNKEFHLLSAPAKVGKTILQINLAIAIAKGESFLGKFSTTKGKVLILQTEVSQANFRKRLLQVTKNKISGFENSIFICNKRIKLNTQEGIQSLKEVLLEYQPNLFILDPFYTLHNANEDSSSEIAPILSDLRDLTIKMNSSCLLIHHQGKGTASNLQVGHKHRGSSSFADVPDGSWSMNKTKDDKVVRLSFELRNISSPHTLEISRDENLNWMSIGYSKQEPSLSIDTIALLLADSGELKSSELLKILMESSGLGKSTVRTKIKQAVETNTIQKRKNGSNVFYSSLDDQLPTKEIVEPHLTESKFSPSCSIEDQTSEPLEERK